MTGLRMVLRTVTLVTMVKSNGTLGRTTLRIETAAVALVAAAIASAELVSPTL